jgi:hypothetical protein
MRTWTFNYQWAADTRTGTCYMVRKKDILALDVGTGKARSIPFSWRRPVPTRYLPQTRGAQPTFLDTSDLRLTPDGKTLILIERLNGDPNG